MKFLSLIPIIMLSSCGALNPEFFKTAESVLTDGVIQVQVDREAFGPTKEVHVSVDVTNSEVTK